MQATAHTAGTLLTAASAHAVLWMDMDSRRLISLAARDRNHPGEAPAKPPVPILYRDGLRALVRQGFSVMSGMTCLLLPLVVSAAWWLRATDGSAPAIRFELKPIAFQLEHGEVVARHVPATMAGGLAVFDYNRDGRPDIFFTNGANLATLKKDDSKYRNRLFRNDGRGVFTDVTESAGLAGTGFDSGVAVGDYDNDGYPDLFVTGVHHNTLYHNNGNGTFTDVTGKAGISNLPDPKYGPMWGITAVWMDVNNDGLLDLFVVNYLQWDYATEPLCEYKGLSDYCSPRSYKGLPNQLYLNKGNGKFEDVSEKWGIRAHVGKGMGGGMADYDLDGRPDLFVTNDGSYNFLFHNLGNKFEEVAFQKGVALTEDGGFISGMGLDFRDFNNDEYPDLVTVAMEKQTFPLWKNTAGRGFQEVTTPSGMRALCMRMAGFGVGFFDFDNDGWKDLFVSRGDVLSRAMPNTTVEQHNTVFRNLGAAGGAEVPEYRVVLLYRGVRHRAGQHVSAADEQILPAVIVEVEKSHAESRHPHAQRAHAAQRRHFLEAFPGRVLPYWKGLVFQRRGYQVWVFVVVEIAKIQPHSGYEAAVFGQRHAFLKRDFLELVAQIVEQEIIRSVVSHE